MNIKRIDEIEDMIARGQMNAAQVFTQMKQVCQDSYSEIPNSSESVGIAQSYNRGHGMTQCVFTAKAVPVGSKLYTQPASCPEIPDSLEDEGYPNCDTCGAAMSYMPWHYASQTDRHLHSCDSCWPKVNPASRQALEGERDPVMEVECECGDFYRANSFGAGFIAGTGMCENCAAITCTHPAKEAKGRIEGDKSGYGRIADPALEGEASNYRPTLGQRKAAQVGQTIGVLAQNKEGRVCAVTDLGRCTWLSEDVTGAGVCLCGEVKWQDCPLHGSKQEQSE